MNVTEKHKLNKDSVVKSIYKICPKCSNFQLHSNKETYCNICGTEYVTKCPSCTEPIIYPISKYCPVCGTKLFSKD